MKRFMRGLAIVFGVILGLIVIFLTIERYRGKFALARYKKELTAKGANLDWRTGFPTPSADDVKKTREFFDAASTITDVNASVCSIETAWSKDLQLGERRVVWKLPNPNVDGSVTWEQLEREMEANRAGRERILRVLETPPLLMSHAPVTLVYSGGVFMKKRQVAQHFLGVVLLDLNKGRTEPALKDLHSYAELTRIHREDSDLPGFIIREAQMGMGCGILWQACQFQGWTDPQLAVMQADFGKRDAFADLISAFALGRVSTVEVYDFVRHHDVRSVMMRELVEGQEPPGWGWDLLHKWEYYVFPFWKYAWADQDELHALVLSQEVLDLLHSFSTNPSWKGIDVSLQQQIADEKKQMRGGLFIPYNRCRYLCFGAGGYDQRSALGRVVQRVMENETMREMAVAAIALKRYQLRHQALPSKLDALVPEIMTQVPMDFMDGQPLRYRVNADGSFTLYSVGLDGVDDGGSTQPPQKGYQSYIRGWDGRDMVWPVPAK